MSRKQTMIRRAGCVNRACPDLWEPGAGNRPGPPGRAVIAIGIGSVFGAVWFQLLIAGLGPTWLAEPVRAVGDAIADLAGGFVAGLSVMTLPMATVPVLAYGLLSWRFGPSQRDRELRCRKCSYILRGLTEPRCPECGEGI